MRRNVLIMILVGYGAFFYLGDVSMSVYAQPSGKGRCLAPIQSDAINADDMRDAASRINDAADLPVSFSDLNCISDTVFLAPDMLNMYTGRGETDVEQYQDVRSCVSDVLSLLRDRGKRQDAAAFARVRSYDNVYLDLRRYNDDNARVSGMRIYYRTDYNEFMNYTTLYYHIEDTDEVYLVQSGMYKSGVIINTTERLIHLLDGSEFDIRNHHSLHSRKDDSFWDGWGDAVEAYTTYTHSIHPLVARVIRTILAKDVSARVPMILDIFGGDGGFIRSLYDRGVAARYHLLERNTQLVEKAAVVLADVPATVAPPTDIVGLHDMRTVISEQPYIVTALGGLNFQTLQSRDDAFRVAEAVFDVLEPGGYFIVTGYTPTYLNAEDYTTIGFEVRNMTVPSEFYFSYGLIFLMRELYIVQKPEGMIGKRSAVDDSAVVPVYRSA